MPLTSVFALLFVGQLLTVVLAQGNCPQRILSETCTRANQIRSSRECVRGHETGAQRPLNDPPTSEYANNCMCTTSYYSVVSACELCNGRQPVTWHVWSQNCKQFAQNGPDNYPIQYSDWAKLTYQDQERFSVDRLRREGYLDEPQQPQPQPEPQPSPQPAPGTTSTRAGSPPTTAAPTAVPTSVNSTSSSTEPSALSESSISGEDTSTSLSQSGSSSASLPIISQSRSSALRNNPNVPNPSDDPFGLGPAAATRGAGNTGTDPDNSFDSDSGKSLNVGAIVGGVVGGLFLLLFIAAFLFFFVLRRRRNRIPASAAYMAQFGDSRVVSARSVPLHSTSNSIENARPESPTLPRSSVDVFNPYSDSSPVTATNPHPVQDPFNPPPENHAEMRENNNVSRQSIRRYTRTPTPLIGPRPR